MKSLQIISPAFENKGNIPHKYTCDGEDVNPPLEFINVPSDTQSLVLIVDDSDSPGKAWIHWMVVNIDPTITKVREDSIPGHGIQAVSDFGEAGYGGPCPANGPHRYNFRLFALDKKLDVTQDLSRIELEEAMHPHILDQAELVGLYSRD